MNNITATYPQTYNVSNSGLNQDKVKASLYASKQVVNDNIESNTMTKLLAGNTGKDNSRFETLMMVPVLSFIDGCVDKMMGGPEEKSLLKKIANIGDKISDKLHLERIFKSEKLSNGINKIKNSRLFKYSTEKFQAVPRTSFAKKSSLAETYSGELSKYVQELMSKLSNAKLDTDFGDIIKQTTSLSDDTAKFLKGLGPLKKDITPDYLDSVVSSLKEIISKLEKNGKQLTKKDIKSIQLLDKTLNAYIANPKSMDVSSLAENIASVLSKFGENAKNIPLSEKTMETLASVAEKKSYSTQQILDVIDDLTANGINPLKTDKLSQLRNKAKVASSQIGNTVLGKNLAKGTLKAKDIVTYGGGIISLFFMASALAQAIKATREAPKGEKKSTFMHVLSEQYLGFILFGPSIQLLYKLGGNKYRGMTEAGRNALKDLIKNTNIDENLTKEGLKIAKIQRDLLIKGVDKDKVAELAGKGLKEVQNLAKSLKKEGAKLKWWEKPLKAMGKLLSTGLDKLQKPTYIKFKGGAIKFKLPKPTLKGFAGGLGRFILIIMVIQPFLQKPITKLCHKIFGEPKSYLEKQKTENNKNDKNNQKVQDKKDIPQKEVPSVQPFKQPEQTKVNSDLSTNLLYNLTHTNPQAQVSDTKETQEIPAVKITKSQKKSTRYIPSIEPAPASSEDKELEARVKTIVKENDILIKKAEKYLN